mmetsp:Transcript_42247/g.100222  ORF Transcript_42247/g.100222 Transcript_42247/m.100222 type:complete len:240 (-) Transcript_42247:155-874(-)
MLRARIERERHTVFLDAGDRRGPRRRAHQTARRGARGPSRRGGHGGGGGGGGGRAAGGGRCRPRRPDAARCGGRRQRRGRRLLSRRCGPTRSRDCGQSRLHPREHHGRHRRAAGRDGSDAAVHEGAGPEPRRGPHPGDHRPPPRRRRRAAAPRGAPPGGPPHPRGPDRDGLQPAVPAAAGSLQPRPADRGARPRPVWARCSGIHRGGLPREHTGQRGKGAGRRRGTGGAPVGPSCRALS